MKLYDHGVFLLDGRTIVEDVAENDERIGRELDRRGVQREAAYEGTIAWPILRAHNRSGSDEKLCLTFDAMTSHDITFVGIVQTARASGLTEFPIPYVLTNCHNSLCAVGGTINEDDHMFGLSAAKRYGGIYVPPHLSVMHMYMRERMAGCGKMILGSDSHTRYGALGTLGIGEGGGELVKQLLRQTYDIDRPRVVGVCLRGRPLPGVGPQDVALKIIGAVFESGYAKNSVLEFVGEGIENLSLDFRCGVDVMTTETACLSSVWVTDERTREYLKLHGREGDYRRLAPRDAAFYDGMLEIDLSRVKPMIALPFHPSNVYEIDALLADPEDILRRQDAMTMERFGEVGGQLRLADKIRNGQIYVDQGIIAGCAGGIFENLVRATQILRGGSTGCGGFSLSVYPASQPILMEFTKNGMAAELMAAGAILRTAFCGPCFGAGDVPANGCLSIRHTTRNFPNREGSKPASGQLSAVALMDARSIAATALNGGRLTPATDLAPEEERVDYRFDDSVYKTRVYNGFGSPIKDEPLFPGPNITPWPEFDPLPENLLMKVCSYITDPVTTTDELIPSGETSAYRSNPVMLAQFTLQRKDPAYVERAKRTQEDARSLAYGLVGEDVAQAFAAIRADVRFAGVTGGNTGLGSVVYAVKPGDGSAREQAASCQRVLGGCANIAGSYATKRYRSNLINWGMLPFTLDGEPPFALDDLLFVPGIREKIREGESEIDAYVARGGALLPLVLNVGSLTDRERSIICAGCLINFYRGSHA